MGQNYGKKHKLMKRIKVFWENLWFEMENKLN